jgi:ribonuclease-3
VEILEKNLKYVFANKALCSEALTHRSYGSPNNERLEFLGDSVLNLVIARSLFVQYPNLAEGDLTRIRSSLVNQEGLAAVAVDLSIGDFLKLGTGEMKTGGSTRPSILSDAVEAIFGAIYLDAGFDVVERVINEAYQPYLDAVNPDAAYKDAKTRLQEYLQGKKLDLPEYAVLDILGEDHNQEFIVSCAIHSLNITVEGRGRSRRVAEQNAALSALDLVP